MKFDFAQKLDLDAVYEGLDMEPISRVGDEDQFICPDWNGAHAHGDTSGKLWINREKVVGQCWVDGGISIPQLVAFKRSISYDEAVDWLYQFTGKDVHVGEFTKRLDKLFEKKPEEKTTPFPYYNVDILSHFEASHPFFAERNISEDVRIKFKCGYDEKRDAVVFPHFWAGQLVGYQRRNLSSKPKYQFTPDFPKAETLWGLDEADGVLPIIVESVPTALTLISAGFPSIATFGASVNETQLKYLRQFNGVILAPDNDTPGEKWFHTIVDNLSPYIRIYSVAPVEGAGADVGDLPKYMLRPHINQTLRLVLAPDMFVNL